MLVDVQIVDVPAASVGARAGAVTAASSLALAAGRAVASRKFHVPSILVDAFGPAQNVQRCASAPDALAVRASVCVSGRNSDCNL